MNTSEGIHIVSILGSVRQDNFTAKAHALVIDELRKLPDIRHNTIDPAELVLPLPGVASESADPRFMREAVAGATGVIFASPEYHGGMSSVIKLVIDNLGFPSVLAGKPVVMLGVAAGAIGAIKSLEQLRSVCSHVGALVLPGPVSVANVQKVFDEKGNCTDDQVEKRIRGVATTLVDYIHAHICPRIAFEELARNEKA